MHVIVVVDQNWGIGKDGDLLCHLRGDLKYFQSKTKGKHIVIGRKTLESFPGGKPLPDRENIVLTSDKEFTREDCTVCYSLTELENHVEKIPDEKIFICGGENVYKQFVDNCHELYVTHILKTFDSDRHFENLDEREDFEETWRSAVEEEKGIRYYFAKYERK